ncbi:MAG: nitronate monooxygenase [Gammaproteobacteria bacterium]|nr:nitronate monooxygenase [Gammaproteobacteria bacterium]
MKCLNDYRMTIGDHELVPIMIGGMGVDISSTDLALVASRLDGVGTISDAMSQTVTDRRYKTRFVKDKVKLYKHTVGKTDKSEVQFDLAHIASAQAIHVTKTMDRKQGNGLIYINVMEKLGMNNPKATLQVRMESAMDAGIDGITLSAGLHLGSMALVKDHPRFNDVHFGIIVSSLRALQLFLRKNKSLNRLPNFIIVEGPLAGGHLGFGIDDWQDYDLLTITREVCAWLEEQQLSIPVIAAGGIFTGTDAVNAVEAGAAGVQVATRFTIAKECGLPDDVKQEYLKSDEDNIEVNTISPTGYPMRMLKNSPAICKGIQPNCESFGYLLDSKGRCSYIDAYNAEVAKHPDAKKIEVCEKTCLCTAMRKFECWTCGSTTYRLKDTTVKNPDGSYLLPDAEHIFKDYQFSVGNKISLPDSVS